MDLRDPAALAAELVRVPSVTPDGGAGVDLVARWLQALGAEVVRVVEDPAVANIVARTGTGGQRIAFAGHTDVVPVGELEQWSFGPFAGTITGGRVLGRGACDMKGAVAATVAALARAERQGEVWVCMTGDEEGPARHGTAAIVRWFRSQGIALDGCVVTEPTSARAVGDTIKIGRRGSLNARITVRGRQGHTAFPSRADNPVHRLAAIVHELTSAPLDAGTARFEPSTLQVSTFDVGNTATNVIPATAACVLNIRFNTEHTAKSLIAWLDTVAARHAPARAEIDLLGASHAFLSENTAFTCLVADTIVETLGRTPQPSTGGGTSDARFLRELGPVVELGTIGHSLHQVDEWVGLDELEELTRIYKAIIERAAEPA